MKIALPNYYLELNMYVTYNNNIEGIRLHTAKTYQTNKPDDKPGKEAGKIPKPFDTVLHNSVTDAYSDIGILKNIPALDKNTIDKLIQIVQAQIDLSLLKAVSWEAPDENLWKLDWFATLHMSKTQQGNQPNEELNSKMDLEHIIDHASNFYNVDRNLIISVMKAESDFDPHCTSKKGAMGLMQLMPETAKELGVENPYDPYENVMAGTKYLKGLLKRYDNDTNSTLAAYNWGMGNLERNPEKLPRETRTYIARVNKFYQDFISQT
jgi:soluble lytic murein transglycosylase-like protein